MRNKEINKVFKQVLKTFVDQMLDPCEKFTDNIDKCETYGELKEFLEENAEHIFESLGGDIKCDFCDDKDCEIENLEDSVTELSSENDEMHDELKKGFVPKSLDDEYKIEAFKAAKDNFSVTEMESLLG